MWKFWEKKPEYEPSKWRYSVLLHVISYTHIGTMSVQVHATSMDDAARQAQMGIRGRVYLQSVSPL